MISTRTVWYRQLMIRRRWRGAAALALLCFSTLILLHAWELSLDTSRLQHFVYQDFSYMRTEPGKPNHLTQPIGAKPLEDDVSSGDLGIKHKSNPTDGVISGQESFNLLGTEKETTPEESPKPSMNEPELTEAERLNNTRKADIDLLVFNRVPKVGSQTIMSLLRQLSFKNDFNFHTDGPHRQETVLLKESEQENLASLLTQYTMPASFTKHLAYINFTRFGLPNPIYVNMVRDPVERQISWFYYMRANWRVEIHNKIYPDDPMPDPAWLEMDFETCVRQGERECLFLQDETHENTGDHRRQVLFFCGQDPECRPFNGAEALEIAKRVVEEQYSVVGLLEDINSTLIAFERYIPRFFAGAFQAHYDRANGYMNYNAEKPIISEEVKDMVRANFTREIEFHQFCRQRLYTQLRALGDPQIVI